MRFSSAIEVLTAEIRLIDIYTERVRMFSKNFNRLDRRVSHVNLTNEI